MVRETMRNHDQHGFSPQKKKHVESPSKKAGSSMSKLGGRVHGIAGQGDQPRSGGHDADAAPQAVAGHDLGSRRGLENRIFGGKMEDLSKGNRWNMEKSMGRWEEHEDFNGESMENGVRLSKMFFLLWELICDTFALFDYRNMLLIVVIEHVGHVGSDKDVLFLFWFSFIRSR